MNLDRVVRTRRVTPLVLAVAALMILAALPASGAMVIRAPVGVWAGDGDHPKDYDVLAIAAGPVGEQSAFWVEVKVGGCGLKPGVMQGVASMSETP